MVIKYTKQNLNTTIVSHGITRYIMFPLKGWFLFILYSSSLHIYNDNLRAGERFQGAFVGVSFTVRTTHRSVAQCTGHVALWKIVRFKSQTYLIIYPALSIVTDLLTFYPFKVRNHGGQKQAFFN